MKLWIVDAFTSKPFEGGPAGVCIVDEFPDKELMQNIATELNFSNSAFIKPLGDHLYHIRWFTPHSEAPLCGHATLASMHILFKNGLIKENQEIILKSLSGELITSVTGEWINLNFPAYEVKEIPFSQQIKDIVNIKPIFNGFGENCLFMEFATPDELKALKPNLDILAKFNCRALIATSHGDKYDFLSRYFAPKVGINEDPVCASAHCRLIPYWSKKLGKNELMAYQASSRGGELKCQYLGKRVLISGKAVTVIEGNLNNINIKELKYVA